MLADGGELMPDVDSTLGDLDEADWDSDTLRAPGSDASTPSERPPAEPPELEAAATVGRYRIVARLGAGGMGVVYRAHDPQLDREVALKLLRAKPGNEQQQASRMLREAKAVAKIRHPNVVTVYDAGEVDGRVFIAMELMRGTDLKRWFERRRPWREVVEVMLQAAQGLRAAHEVGLIHRDFKPDNVFVEDDGSVKVLDFGLARPAYDEQTQSQVAEELGDALTHLTGAGLQTLTRTGALMGTPAFMSPEQYLLQPLDARTDQFSFCVTLFSGVYGQRPFAGRNPAALTMSVVNGKLELPEDPSVAPARLLELLRRGLSTDPADRYPSMDALIEQLQRILADERERGGRRRIARWATGGLVVGAVAMAIDILLVWRTPGEVSTTETAGDDPPTLVEPTTSVAELEPLRLTLAAGEGRNKPVDGAKLFVAPDRLRVEGPAPDMLLHDGRFKRDGPAPSEAERLRVAALFEALEPLEPATVYDPLTLYLDRQIPFATLAQIIYNGGRAGFVRYDLAVRGSDDEVRVFEVSPPLFGYGEGPLRRRFALELELDAERVRVGARAWAPNDEQLADAPERWSLDVGAGTCELPLAADAQLAALGRLAAELCTLDGVSIPLIVRADDELRWQQLARVLGAALPSPACSHGIVIELGGEALPDCADAVTVAELGEDPDDASEPEPEFRRWCFINSSLRSQKVCRSTQAACVAEAKHWVEKPRKACRGER